MACSVGTLIVLQCPVSSKKCLNIAADQVHPAILILYLEGGSCFMHANATTHRVRIPQQWFSEHDRDFHHLSWPPQSPDLNLTEKVWDILECKIWEQSPLTSNLSLLQDCLMNAWYALDLDALQRLVEFMPNHSYAKHLVEFMPHTHILQFRLTEVQCIIR